MDKDYQKDYYEKNREKILARKKKRYERTKVIVRKSLTEEERRAYRNNYYKNRRKNDPSFKLRTSISANINFYLKVGKGGESCLNHLPFSLEQLKQHLESLFEDWMNWSNHGKFNKNSWNDSDPTTWTWQIDHIVPQSTFSYSSMEDEEFKKCWDLRNLRPYSAKQNFFDGINRVRHKKA